MTAPLRRFDVMAALSRGLKHPSQVLTPFSARCEGLGAAGNRGEAYRSAGMTPSSPMQPSKVRTVVSTLVLSVLR